MSLSPYFEGFSAESLWALVFYNITKSEDKDKFAAKG
jgi:hypothetical protein